MKSLILTGVIVIVVAVVGMATYITVQPAGLFVQPVKTTTEPEEPLLSQTPIQSEKTAYFYANGQKIVSMSSGSVLYYLTDHLGGTNRVYDQDGNLVSENEYYAYGQDKLETGQGQDYKYTDKEEDDSTGLYYYGARYYEPLMGRFTAIDKVKGKIGSPQNLNRYAYVQNNPLTRADPSGNLDMKMNLPSIYSEKKEYQASPVVTDTVDNGVGKYERTYFDPFGWALTNVDAFLQNSNGYLYTDVLGMGMVGMVKAPKTSLTLVKGGETAAEEINVLFRGGDKDEIARALNNGGDLVDEAGNTLKSYWTTNEEAAMKYAKEKPNGMVFKIDPQKVPEGFEYKGVENAWRDAGANDVWENRGRLPLDALMPESQQNMFQMLKDEYDVPDKSIEILKKLLGTE